MGYIIDNSRDDHKKNIVFIECIHKRA